MGVLFAYCGSMLYRSPTTLGRYYNEDPSQRAYLLHDGLTDELVFDTLISKLVGVERVPDAKNSRFTLFSPLASNSKIRTLSLCMFAVNQETWPSRKVMEDLGSFHRHEPDVPLRRDKWCNGGDYTEVCGNFNEIAHAFNLRVWGEHWVALKEALTDCMRVTNAVV